MITSNCLCWFCSVNPRGKTILICLYKYSSRVVLFGDVKGTIRKLGTELTYNHALLAKTTGESEQAKERKSRDQKTEAKGKTKKNECKHW